MTLGHRSRLDDVETLSDYETRRAREDTVARRESKMPPPRLTCDRCGTELDDELRLTYHTTHGADLHVALYHALQRWLNRPVKVWCPECGWKGTRTR